MVGFFSDLRDAAKAVWRGRKSLAWAFVVLSLAMAAGTVTFSVVDSLVLRPLPFGQPERLVAIGLPGPFAGRMLPTSPQDFYALSERLGSVEAVGAARFVAPVTVRHRGQDLSLTARVVTVNLFDMLRVRAAVGRLFSPEHLQSDGADAVVLGYEAWRDRFGADRSIVGTVLMGTPRDRLVIGVLPAGVSFPITSSAAPDVYVPLVPTATDRANNRATSMFVVARLRAGIGLEVVRADVQRVVSAIVMPLREQVAGPAQTWLLLALAAAGFTLLVGCLNVAILFLARSTARAREHATRQALGGSSGRLARSLLLEGLVVSFAAMSAAVLLAWAGVRVAAANLPPELVKATAPITVDGRVFLASGIAVIFCAVLFSSAPAWAVGRGTLVDRLKGGVGPLAGGRRGERAVSAFLVADVTFISALLVATLLVVTSYVEVVTADLGFERANVIQLSYRRSLTGTDRSAWEAAAATTRADLLTAVRLVPGVVEAAITRSAAPLSGTRGGLSMSIPGYGRTTAAEADSHVVTPGYFNVLGMRLLRGRLLQATDRLGAPPVMVINDVAANRYFAGREPLGQVVSLDQLTMVVGIVKGVYSDGPEAVVRPAIYTPLEQMRHADIAIVPPDEALVFGRLLARTARGSNVTIEGVQAAMTPVLGGQTPQAMMVEDFFRQLTAVRRFTAGTMAVFGFVAVAIGALGVFGTMAFMVGRQTRSIGLRLALGASPATIRRWVLRQALGRVGLGVMFGLALSWAGSSSLSAYVFGVSVTQPSAYALVAAFVGIVAIGGAVVPALRASRLNPLVALGRE